MTLYPQQVVIFSVFGKIFGFCCTDSTCFLVRMICVSHQCYSDVTRFNLYYTIRNVTWTNLYYTIWIFTGANFNYPIRIVTVVNFYYAIRINSMHVHYLSKYWYFSVLWINLLCGNWIKIVKVCINAFLTQIPY